MTIGDKIKMSDKNSNHLNNDVCAYAGMEGVVTEVYNDGSFVLNCGNCILVVPMWDAFKQPKEGVWIWLNGHHVFHKRIDNQTTRNRSKLRRFFNKIFF